MVSPNSLKKLFRAIATQHPLIANTQVTANDVTTDTNFFGYNNDEALMAEHSTLKYAAMGMSLKSHTGLSGRYTAQGGGSMMDTLMPEIVLIDKVEKGDFEAEYEVYDNMKQLADDIVTWLQHIVSTDKLNYPAVGFLNIQTVQYSRVGPVHQNCYGWKLSFMAMDEIIYLPATNPLNSMPPVPY